MTDPKNLIGLAELAEVLDVTKNEANSIRQRPGFPLPIIKLRMGPAWDKNQVLEWVASTLEDHSVRRTIPCAHCGGPTWILNPSDITTSDINVTIRLQCKSGCSLTLMYVGLSTGDSGFETAIRTSKEIK